MPTYEYRCDSCSHQFEVFAKMSDPAPEACESCGGAALSKLLFPVAVHYKGSGFYSTDYSGKKSATSDDSGSSTESGSKGSDAGGASGGSSDSSSSSSSTSDSTGSSGTSASSSNDG